jgi:hypothetical protein
MNELVIALSRFTVPTLVMIITYFIDKDKPAGTYMGSDSNKCWCGENEAAGGFCSKHQIIQ